LEIAGTIGGAAGNNTLANSIRTFTTLIENIQGIRTFIGDLANLGENESLVIDLIDQIRFDQPPAPTTFIPSATADNKFQEVINKTKNTRSGSASKIAQLLETLQKLPIKPLIFENIPGLLAGQDVPLIGLDLPKAEFRFSVEREFPIYTGFPSINGLLQGSFGLTVDVDFGFDTSGINRLAKKIKEKTFNPNNPLDILLPLDGFYISDRVNLDGSGLEKPELTMDARIAVGAGLDFAKIVEGYVLGGVTGLANLDLIDVGEVQNQSDGRIHASEIVQQARGGLFNVFRLSGEINLFLGILVKVLGSKVYARDFPVAKLFEFDLGPTGKSIGSAFDGYVTGSLVFFDANFNGLRDEFEPATFTNGDGSYTLETPLFLFDTNKNGVIDPDEGQIVILGGADTSTLLPLLVPIKAPADSTQITPLNTLVAKLSELDLATAETKLQNGLGLAIIDVDLLSFDMLAALSSAEPALQQNGLLVLQANTVLQVVLTRTAQAVWDKQPIFTDPDPDREDPRLLLMDRVANALLDRLVEGIGGGSPLALGDLIAIETLLKTVVVGPGVILGDLLQAEAPDLYAAILADVAKVLQIANNTGKSVKDRLTELGDEIIRPLLDLDDFPAGGALVPVTQDLFSRLTRKLAESARTVDQAREQVLESFGLPSDIDLRTYNAIEAANNGSLVGLNTFATQVKLQSLFIQVTALLQGREAGAEPLVLAERVVDVVSQFLLTGADLSNLAAQQTLQNLIGQAVPQLGAGTIGAIAALIANLNSKIQGIINNPSLTIEEKLLNIAAIQRVSQNEFAQALEDVGAGTKTVGALQSEFTGSNLDTLIAEALQVVNNPAVRVEVDNNPPVAANDRAVTGGNPITIDVLANDSDPDGDPLTVTLVTSTVQNPAFVGTNEQTGGKAAITADGKSVLFTPNPDFKGTTVLNYAIADGRGGVANAQIALSALPGVYIDKTTLQTAEDGASDSFRVNLKSEPTASVTINFTFNPVEGRLSTSTLTFNASNWFTPQTVTVTGVNDFVLDGNVAYTINSTIATNDANYTAIVPTPVSVTNVATFTLAGTANSSPGVLSQAVGVGGSIVLGNRNSDVTKGSNGADTISAFDGDDLVIGGDGNDSIDGGLGNDTLFGGKGSDTLIGSIGSDVIFYSAPDEGVDAISGFLVTEDKLAFFGQAFGLTPGALAASQFTTGTAATAIAHRFVYNAGQLFFDPDGSGALPQVPLASFVGTPLITNTNFVII